MNISKFEQTYPPKIMGWYWDGPLIDRMKTAFYGLRPIPNHIKEKGPNGRLTNSVQVLSNCLGSYMWINIDKDQINVPEIGRPGPNGWEYSKEYLEFKALWGKEDPQPAIDCWI